MSSYKVPFIGAVQNDIGSDRQGTISKVVGVCHEVRHFAAPTFGGGGEDDGMLSLIQANLCGDETWALDGDGVIFVWIYYRFGIVLKPTSKRRKRTKKGVGLSPKGMLQPIPTISGVGSLSVFSGTLMVVSGVWVSGTASSTTSLP